jgi:hypothetical protein
MDLKVLYIRGDFFMTDLVEHADGREQRIVKLVTEVKPFQLGALDLECAVGQCTDGSYVDLLSSRRLEKELGNTSHSHGSKIVQVGSTQTLSKMVQVPLFEQGTQEGTSA